MPLVDSNLESTWNSLYSCLIGNQTVGFDRAAKQQYFGNDHFTLKNALRLTARDGVVLIGGAFGWIAEDWIADGLSVVVTDTSTWIHANKVTQSLVPILNESALTDQSRTNIAEAIGRPITVAITEDVMPNLADDECIELSSALRLLAPKVVHWVTCGLPSLQNPLNMKSTEQWKALLSPDLIVQRGRGEVI